VGVGLVRAQGDLMDSSVALAFTSFQSGIRRTHCALSKQSMLRRPGIPMGSDVSVGRKSLSANALSFDSELTGSGHVGKADSNVCSYGNARHRGHPEAEEGE
jgi:hypothetical protein